MAKADDLKIKADLEIDAVTISVKVGRSCELKKSQWFSFEYAETQVVKKSEEKKARENLWKKAIKEVDNQVADVKDFLGV